MTGLLTTSEIGKTAIVPSNIKQDMLLVWFELLQHFVSMVYQNSFHVAVTGMLVPVIALKCNDIWGKCNHQYHERESRHK